MALAAATGLSLAGWSLRPDAVQAAGTVSLTSMGSPYAQDFDTLASSGTSSTVPTGWDFSEAGTNANTAYTAGTGSGNAGDTYSFGASGATERAFGGLQSGSLIPLVGAQFTNNTGGTITSLAVAYVGEQWRLGTVGRPDRLDFQYSLDATSLTSGTWVDVDDLDFIAPTTAGTVGALDGNAAANRTARDATISGLSIPAGASFWIRWTDFNASSADDGLAVDDFSITPQGTIEVPAPKVNEFSASTAGTDVEYVEIVGAPDTDYSAYTVLEIEGDAGAAAGTVDEVISLGTTGPNGLFLVNLPANALENGTLTLLLVKNFTGALNQDLDANNDGVLDVAPWEAIVDAVAVNDGGAGDLTYGVPALGVSYDGLPFAPGGASRIPDGTDTDTAADWVRNDFDLAGIPGFDGTPVVGEALNTPGAQNQAVTPPPPQLVINEIDYDQPGTDTAEFVEIRNKGSVAVSLGGWTLELVNGNNGGAAVYNTVTLPNVSLAAGDYFVVCANAATVANCDLDASPDTDFVQNGAPDAVGLRFNGVLMDSVSYEGNTGAPYTEGSGAGLTDTAAGAEGISRCPDGADTNVNNVDLRLAAITPGAANVCVAADVAPSVVSSVPAGGATNVALNTSVTVTFSEPVYVTGEWFTLDCGISGLRSPASGATVTGGPTAFTIDPSADFVAGESCMLTVFGALVTDQDADDPPDTMTTNFVASFTTVPAVDPCTLPYTPIPAIQGSGAEVVPGPVTTMGVVVGDYEGPSPALRGFFIQDPVGDGDPATSDGIFVFNGSNANSVSLGQLVRITGTAGENQGQSQISVSSANIIACGTGTVTPTDITFPVPSADYLERFEGMLVRLSQTMYVTEHFQLGRFGQVVLSANGRLVQPTEVVPPGAPAIAQQAANDLNRIILDDASQTQNPDPIVFARGGLPLSAGNTLRGGDTATGIVGVLNYTWAGNSASGNAYRVRPGNALGGTAFFEPTNPRPATVPEVGGTVRVASANVLNYFNTFDGLPDSVDNCTFGVGGLPADCRGADTQAEFDRQWPKTVAALLATGADVLGLIEVENDGYGVDSAIQHLVDRLNAATAPGTWAFIDADAGTGQLNSLGTDAVKSAIVYRTGSVTPVGQTAVINTGAFGLFQLSDGRIQGRNRPTLAQTFEAPNGARVTVVVNHLVSKGAGCDANVTPVGPDPDTGDGQGLCNITRTTAMQELVAWLGTDPTGVGDADFLLVGDFNAYKMEDPLAVLTNASFVELASSLLGPGSYSYVFDGQWGSLDHAFVSPTLNGQVTGFGIFHVNADEPSVLDYNTDFKSAGQIAGLYAPDMYRMADHDPLIVGLHLRNDVPVITYVSPAVTIYEGQSTVLEAIGYDPDGGPVSYAWDLDNDGTFETPGQTAVFWGTNGVGPFTVKVRVTDQSGLSATASTTVTVWFNWTGFYSPILNEPAVNARKAGSAVPVKFSLGGDKGLAIFAAGYPVSTSVDCATGQAGTGSPTANPGNSGLSYDPLADQYTYVWKTEKAWAGTCRQLSVTLVDGSTHTAFFSFR